MERNGVFGYKFPDDDTSDDSSSSSSNSSSSSSSSSNSSTISKKQNQIEKNDVESTKNLTPFKTDLSLLIDRLERHINIRRKDSLGEEISSETCSSAGSKEEDEDSIEEAVKLIKIESREEMFKNDEDSITNNLECSDNESLAEAFYRLGPSATSQQIASWMICHGFKNYIEIFDGFSYFDLRRLTRTDLIDMCGTVRGIQLYNAIQMKPVLPLRTVYCGEELPDNKGIDWQGVYLHSLNAQALDTQIVMRFHLPSRKHSLWMEGPYGINILVNNETVEYMDDNDMFLIQVVEYPSVEHYKIILKKYM